MDELVEDTSGRVHQVRRHGAQEVRDAGVAAESKVLYSPKGAACNKESLRKEKKSRRSPARRGRAAAEQAREEVVGARRDADLPERDEGE